MLEMMADLSLADWGALATILTLLISIPTYYSSASFHEFVVEAFGKAYVRLLLLATSFFLAGWFTGSVVPSNIPQLIDRSAPPQTWPPVGGILADVKRRGYLKCGVNSGLTGFGTVSGIKETNEKAYYKEANGFDVDFCRVIAAAIFGTAQGTVRYLPLEAESEIGWRDRFSAVEQGHVDVLFRNTSATAGREILKNIEFGPTIFYDGQSFLVESDSNLTALADFQNPNNFADESDPDRIIRICVAEGTTHLNNLAVGLREKLNIDYEEVTETKNGKKIEDNTASLGSLSRKHCDVISGDRSALMSLFSENVNRYRVFDEIISKELLSPVVVEGDSKWADVVRYSIYATIEAAELGINKDNVESDFGVASEQNSYIQSFLGRDNSTKIAEKLDLDGDFVENIIQHVGNYNDIFRANLSNRHMYEEKRGPNQIWGLCDQTQEPLSDVIHRVGSCGLLVSPPFSTPISQRQTTNPDQ